MRSASFSKACSEEYNGTCWIYLGTALSQQEAINMCKDNGLSLPISKELSSLRDGVGIKNLTIPTSSCAWASNAYVGGSRPDLAYCVNMDFPQSNGIVASGNGYPHSVICK